MNRPPIPQVRQLCPPSRSLTRAVLAPGSTDGDDAGTAVNPRLRSAETLPRRTHRTVFRVWRGDQASCLTTQRIPTEWRRSVDLTVAGPHCGGSLTVEIEMAHGWSQCLAGEWLRRRESRLIRRRIGTGPWLCSRPLASPFNGIASCLGEGITRLWEMGPHQTAARWQPERRPDHRATGKRAWGATTRGSECRRPWSWPGCPPHLSRLTIPERGWLPPASNRLRRCRPDRPGGVPFVARTGRLSALGRFGQASSWLRLAGDPDGCACRRDHARGTISPDGLRRHRPKQFPARRAGRPPAGPAGSATWLAA